MTAAVPSGLMPTFIDGPAGPLFAIYHPPKAGRPERGDVLYLHPFAEEMNRARRMAALQARLLADAGFGTLLLDFYGCGDSAGDFVDARWEIWLGDAMAAIAWLRRDRPRQLSLLGLRLGGLLAIEIAAAQTGSLERIVLWQPVLDGSTMMTQLLRVRVAAGMGEAAGNRETTGELRQRLERGESLEVAGYEMAPELVRSIDQRRIASLGPAPSPPVHWFEAVRDEAAGIALASQRIIEGWREKDARVSAEAVVGEPFWNLPETTLAPGLLAATRRVFEEGRACR